jgi:hypothetical protein
VSTAGELLGAGSSEPCRIPVLVIGSWVGEGEQGRDRPRGSAVEAPVHRVLAASLRS